jgi:hypothetical protein
MEISDEEVQFVVGTLRITNPKTLEKWKQDGRYKELIDLGYIYAPGCGRFRLSVCFCAACRRKSVLLKEVFEK